MTTIAKFVAVPLTYATACTLWFATATFLVLMYFAMGGHNR